MTLLIFFDPVALLQPILVGDIEFFLRLRQTGEIYGHEETNNNKPG
jgi:hypothetical protein